VTTTCDDEIGFPFGKVRFELEFCAKPLRGRSEVTPYMAGLLDWDQKLLLIAM